MTIESLERQGAKHEGGFFLPSLVLSLCVNASRITDYFQSISVSILNLPHGAILGRLFDGMGDRGRR